MTSCVSRIRSSTGWETYTKKKKKKKEKKWKGEKEKMFVQSYGTNILEKWESMAGWKWK